MNSILRTISTIRDSFIGSQQVYTEGSCYHFYLILKCIYPDAKAYDSVGHILTKIDNKYYDITGEVIPDMDSVVEANEVPTYSLNKPFNIYKDR